MLHNLRLVVLIGLLYAFLPEVSSYGKTYSAMSGYKPLKEMLDSLFEGYEKRVRPFDKSSPLEIHLNTYIIELVHVDEYHKEFTLDLYLREYWIDPRLTFIPKPNIGASIQLDPESSKNMWIPDTFVANERKHMYYQDSVIEDWIRVKSNGEIRRSVRRTLTASCPMTFYFYPFDRHLCTLEIESYSHSSEQIHYDWQGGMAGPMATGISLNATNGTVVPFRVMSLHANRYEIELSSGNFSRLEVEITLQKFYGVFVSKYYVPLFLFVIVALTTLWIRHAKFSLFLNFVNLVFSHLFLLIPDIGAKVPWTDYYKANDLFLYICLAFLYFSFLVSIAILICNKYQEEGFAYKEPKTYIRIAKDPSPDERLRKEPLLEGSLERTQLRHIGTQTSLESAIYKILKICRILRWSLILAYILINIIFWTLLVLLSESYIWPEHLIYVDFDYST